MGLILLVPRSAPVHQFARHAWAARAYADVARAERSLLEAPQRRLLHYDSITKQHSGEFSTTSATEFLNFLTEAVELLTKIYLLREHLHSDPLCYILKKRCVPC